jgi:hypothetical protein
MIMMIVEVHKAVGLSVWSDLIDRVEGTTERAKNTEFG